MQEQQWTRQGSRAAPYVIQLRGDGRLSCDCPGWTVKRQGKPRACKHTTEIARQFATEQRDDGQYVVPWDGTKAQIPDRFLEYVERNTGIGPLETLPDGRIAVKSLYRPLMLADKLPEGRWITDYDDGQWVMEQKYDGERVLAVVRGGVVSAFSRAGGGRSEGLARDLGPQITAQLARLPAGAYDGEIVVGATGRSNDVRRLTNAGGRTLVLFDLLECLDDDVAHLPYHSRRDLLVTAAQALEPTPAVIVASNSQPDEAILMAIWNAGGEGVILKRRDAPYTGRRSPDWLKIKAHGELEAEIIGFEAGLSGPHSTIVFRMDSGIESRCKTLNADWHRRIAAGSIRVGTRIEVAYQVLMESGKPRHPMAKRVVGEA